MRRAAIACVGLLALVGCAGPARTFGAYEGKAKSTADQVNSAVATVSLAVGIVERGRAFGPYTSVVVTNAESDASAVQGAFDAIQPPGPDADRLRDQLDGLMTSAVSAISKIRIAVRRQDFGSLPGLAVPLNSLSNRLSAFAKAHS